MAQLFLTLHLYLQTGYARMRAQSHQLCLTPWTVAHQAPLSMGFSRHEYRSGLPYPPLEALPDPAIELASACISVRHCRWIIYDQATKEAQVSGFLNLSHPFQVILTNIL